jgi:outer membrane protein assembly factor BamB
MKRNHFLLIAVLIGLTLAMSACVPGPRVTGTPGIALSGDMAFVSYANFVYGLDAATGSVEWAYPDESNNQIVFYAPPLATEDFVYVGGLANEFHKLDKETGALIWTFSDASGYYIGQAAEVDGVVYAPCNDGALYALDQNGDLLWKFETGHYIWTQPQVVGDMIYFGSMDHSVYAISTDGEELWSQGMAGAVVASPLISEDGSVLYVGSLGDQMVALDAEDGDVLWYFDTAESVWGEAVLIEDSLYFADSDGNVYVLDPASGTLQWQIEVGSPVVGGLTALEDGFILATEDGVVKAYDIEGTPKWETTPGGEIVQAPVLNEDYIIVGSIGSENLVYGFNPAGIQLWSTTPEN